MPKRKVGPALVAAIALALAASSLAAAEERGPRPTRAELETLQAAVLEKAEALLPELEPEHRSSLERRLGMQWLRQRPLHSIRLCLASGDSYEVKDAFEKWAKLDGDAARRHALEQVRGGMRQHAVAGVIEGMAPTNPREAEALLPLLSDSDLAADAVAAVARGLAKAHLEDALELLERLEGRNRSRALHSLLFDDPPLKDRLEILSRVPRSDRLRDAHLASLVRHVADKEPERIPGILEQIEDESRRSTAAADALKLGWEPPETFDWGVVLSDEAWSFGGMHYMGQATNAQVLALHAGFKSHASGEDWHGAAELREASPAWFEKGRLFEKARASGGESWRELLEIESEDMREAFLAEAVSWLAERGAFEEAFDALSRLDQDLPRLGGMAALAKHAERMSKAERETLLDAAKEECDQAIQKGDVIQALQVSTWAMAEFAPEAGAEQAFRLPREHWDVALFSLAATWGRNEPREAFEWIGQAEELTPYERIRFLDGLALAMGMAIEEMESPHAEHPDAKPQ